MRLFLNSFLNDWWDSICKFFRGLDNTIVVLIITFLSLLTLLCLIRFLKPMYSADKNRIRVMPLVFMVLFGALTALVCTATYA